MIETGRYRTTTPDQMEELGQRIGEAITTSTVLLLVGDLGAGKTLFVRGLAQGLGVDPDEVSSPTFSLVNRYAGGRLPLFHLDLYRIDDAKADAALYELGIEEMLDGPSVVAIEWADRLDAFPGDEAYLVRIDYEGDDCRSVAVERALSLYDRNGL